MAERKKESLFNRVGSFLGIKRPTISDEDWAEYLSENNYFESSDGSVYEIDPGSSNFLYSGEGEDVIGVGDNIGTRASITRAINKQNLKDALKGVSGVDDDESGAGMPGFSGLQNTLSSVGAIVGAFDNDEHSAATNAIDAGMSGAMNIVGEVGGPYGKIAKVGYQAADVINKGMHALGVENDEMTGADKFFDSTIGGVLGGWIMNAAGKKSDELVIDDKGEEAMENVGSSYGGTMKDINDAKEKSGKFYSAASARARKKANKQIAEAQNDLNTMKAISGEASEQHDIVDYMNDQTSLAYANQLLGGYDMKGMRVEKGGKIEPKKKVKKPGHGWCDFIDEGDIYDEDGNVVGKYEVMEGGMGPEMISGKFIPEILDEIFCPEIMTRNFSPEIMIADPRAGSSCEMFVPELIHDVMRMIAGQKDMNIQHRKIMDDGLREHMDAVGRTMGMENDMCYEPGEEIIEVKTTIKKIRPHAMEKCALEGGPVRPCRMRHEAMPEMIMIEEDPSMLMMKKGGRIEKQLDAPEIEESGMKNLIPEGALHKNKHRMDNAEGFTKKGIPVVDDNMEQQAEIERNEIIFNKEVTDKLEEYYKIYFSDKSTPEEKDIALIETGKLLTSQIMLNTDDRTGLIKGLKRGGKLQDGGKAYEGKSLDELVRYAEEVNPRFIQRLNEFPKILTFERENGKEHGSHLLSYTTDDDNNPTKAWVFPMIMEDENGRLVLYDDPRLAAERGDELEMTPDEAEYFTSHYKEHYNDYMKQFDEMEKFLNAHPGMDDMEVYEFFRKAYK